MIAHAWRCECGGAFIFDERDHTALSNMAKNHAQWPEHRELSPGHECRRTVKPFVQWAAERSNDRLA